MELLIIHSYRRDIILSYFFATFFAYIYTKNLPIMEIKTHAASSVFMEIKPTLLQSFFSSKELGIFMHCTGAMNFWVPKINEIQSRLNFGRFD